MPHSTSWLVATSVALAMTACSGKDGDSSGPTGAGQDTSDIGDTSESVVEAIYPTADMDRVLLYYGNGGFDPTSSKGLFDDFDEHVKQSFGWNTDHRSDWNDDLSSFRVVGLVALGHAGGEDLDATQIDALKAALARGTRVVFFGDRESCGSTVMANALAALGSSMSYTGESADLNQLALATDLSSSQLTEGLGTVTFKEPCWINSSGGSRDINHVDYVVGASQRPFTGGDIVVLGDFQSIDDSGYLTNDSYDNRLFAENLVKVDPAL